MAKVTSTDGNGTPPTSSCLSASPTLLPAWAPPKSPLPPHRLAKLANALGVSTPMPAVHNNAPFMSRTLLDNPTLDPIRRSPTPSMSTAASIAAYSSSVSKYLLHVIPPLHLPHESDEDVYVTPPPANASGYHTQFRRGTLVPVYSTLQAQLTAIAKEYALPSTAGLVIYLVSSAKMSLQRASTPQIELQDDGDEPGPRLSEEVWKHLWSRVMKTEQREDYLPPPSRNHTPIIFGLPKGAQSTPFLPQDGPLLRPLLSLSPDPVPARLQSRFPPSPSTPSTTSDLPSNTKSAPASASSVSHSEPETPDTSTDSHSFIRNQAVRKDSLDLPGLDSSSVIPILAKVEFDIDRRKAAWYDPWLRSRRMNHVKRTESRAGRKGSINEDEESQDTYVPVSLVTGDKEASNLVLSRGAALTQQPTPMSVGYKALPEPPDDDDESEGGSNGDELVAHAGMLDGDPLADVFGTDANTWAATQSSPRQGSKRNTNPNVVPLAMNATDLAALPNSSESGIAHLGNGEDEVQDLLDQMSRPQFSVTNPSPRKRSSSLTSSRKHVPPPLVLNTNTGVRDLAVPTEASPMPSSAGSTYLAYMHGSPSGEASVSGSGEQPEAEDDGLERLRNPEGNEKRGGAVFDDLDLGLDPTEDFDDGDPYDRRRSQFLMKAQLDEIERTMVQLSPRILHTDLTEEPDNISATSSPNKSLSLSPGKWNGTYSPRLRQQHSEASNASDSLESKGQAWPAVPFSSISDTPKSPPPSRLDGPPSPPRLAVNGITTSAPSSFVAKSRLSASEMSTETQMRKRALEEEQSYAGFAPPTIPTESPIIPLSPDPFGRFSNGRSSAYWETETAVQPPSSTLSAVTNETHSRNRSTSSAATSRFSMDSVNGEEPAARPATRSTLMTVNTIKRLWRKSGKNVPMPNTAPPPPPPPVGGRTSMQVPQRPERPSEEQLDLTPNTPTTGRFSPQLAPSRKSPELPPTPQPSSPQPHQQTFPQQLPVHPLLPQHLPVPQQLPAHPQTHQLTVPQPQQLPAPQLAIPQPPQRPPPFAGRPSIVAAQMVPNRGSASVEHLHFDQESPYPTRRIPPSPQLTQSPPLPSASPRINDIPLALPPTPPDKERPSARKSILKGWKAATSSTSQPSNGETRSSVDRPTERSSIERPNVDPLSNVAARSRRPSILNFGSSRSSVVSPPPDIPPSPQIPQQYVDLLRNEHRQSVKSKLSSGSVDYTSSGPAPSDRPSDPRSASPQRSRRSSQSSRPSFDTSQFEIVSPKINSTLSYPYHELDHN